MFKGVDLTSTKYGFPIPNDKSIFKGIVDRFGFGDSNTGTYRLYPNAKEHENTIQQENWSKVPFPYTLEILNIRNQPDKNFRKFELPIPPSSLEQTEEFAVSIRPTQGGTIVTHSGNRYKTLVLKGTTGITPNSNGFQVDARTGEVVTAFNLNATDFNLKYKSGFEVFMHLKNWFKAYQDFKTKAFQDHESMIYNGRYSKMVFRNYKDGESLIVESPKFKMIQQASKPFFYDYEIIFRVIGALKLEEPKDAEGIFGIIDNILGGIDDVTDAIHSSVAFYNNTLTQIDAFYTTNLVSRYYKCVNAYNVLTGVDKPFLDVNNLKVKKDASALADRLVNHQDNLIRNIQRQHEYVLDQQEPVKPVVEEDPGRDAYETSIKNAKLNRDKAITEYDKLVIKKTFEKQKEIIARRCTYHYARSSTVLDSLTTTADIKNKMKRHYG